MEKYFSLFVFVLSYAGFIMFPARRAYCACAGALALLLLGAIGPWEAVEAINWNVMGIFVGTLVVAELFMFSKMPAYLAEHLVNRSSNTCVAMLFVCGLTSIMSAFTENVATVLIAAPIALAIADRLDVNPSLFIIALAICSNLQGTATLIGDPPSMILAGWTGMTFNDFFFYQGRPSIFFAVEIGAVASFFVLYFLFRRFQQPVGVIEVEKVTSWVPTWMLVLLMVALALSSFLDPGFGYMAGLICMVFGIFGLVWYKATSGDSMREFVKALDWDTTLFLMGIFIIVGGLISAGWIDEIAVFIRGISGNSVFGTFVMIVFLSVVFSAFIDNVPFLLAMIPVSQQLGQDMQSSPMLLLFGLLVGACLGGNITPVGASANIVAVGILRKRGVQVTFMEFVKVGLPFTIVAVVSSCIFLWVVWK